MEIQDFTENVAILNLLERTKEACQDKVFSDIIDDEGHQYIDFVMEGGGALGIALVGYTYVLEEMGLRFLDIGGTSAGSINALLLAALGTPQQRKSEQILRIIANMDMHGFVDGDADVKDLIQAVLEGAGKITLGLKAALVLDTLDELLGLNPGEMFLHWLSSVLDDAGVPTLRQLEERMRVQPNGLRRRDGAPLQSHEQEAELALITADITTETKVQFPKMAPLYWQAPSSISPALFVRASMSIPLFFTPFWVENIPQGKEAWKNWKALAGYNEELPTRCAFVDGGIMSNFPIDVFHSNSVPSAPTFGVKLGPDKRLNQIQTPSHLLKAIFNSARHTLDYDFIARHPDYRKLVNWIDTGAHNWLNFSMPDEDKIDLFLRGARAAANFLVHFDWTGYKHLRRQLITSSRLLMQEKEETCSN